jgi:uncharacterized OB-fold protein
MLTLLKPALYGRSAEEASRSAYLKGGRCKCGYVFFPWQSFGCERCGDVESLQPIDLAGRGSVLSSVTVHLHATSDRPTPFVIAAVRLVDGPVVRTLLAERSGAVPRPLPPEHAVVAELFEVSKAGDPSATVLDLRFVAVDAQQGNS